MEYAIEISFNINKNNNITELKEAIISIALDYTCSNYYYHIEMSNDTRIYRNHCVIIFKFKEEDIENCASFIKCIRRIQNVYVECVYQEEVTCKLLYASQYYLTTMDKSKIKMYHEFRKEQKYTEKESIIINAILDKKRRSETI
jgi:hypothetical protein